MSVSEPWGIGAHVESGSHVDFSAEWWAVAVVAGSYSGVRSGRLGCPGAPCLVLPSLQHHILKGL